MKCYAFTTTPIILMLLVLVAPHGSAAKGIKLKKLMDTRVSYIA